MIPKRNLSLLANRLYKEHGGRRIPEAVLERDYCLAWFLVGLSQSRLGSFLSSRVAPPSSVVISATTASPKTSISRCRAGGSSRKFAKDWTRFSSALPRPRESISPREDRQHHANNYSFYLSYQGPLPHPNTVKVDITISEVLLFPVGQRPVLRAYPEFEDLPEDRLVAVYGLNEIVTEKVVALSDPARNEPRNLYDLWYLTVEPGVDLSQLVEAITEKLRFRQKNIAGLEGRILQKEQRLKALWTGRLGHQIEALPEFDEVFRAVRR